MKEDYTKYDFGEEVYEEKGFVFNNKTGNAILCLAIAVAIFAAKDIVTRLI